ncbi:MAG: 50S ribosomal protein L5 [Pelagibacteraceae bacterium TMED237]|nr:MAG: 50S ribosomal protein L5 [Pelagibacteraceae bacterium TMED237]|tara:strand:+ start:7438 stop:7989 length:552 start_codon:yes stop_codon:yes gene_type:complete
MSRLLEEYNKSIKLDLKTKLKFENLHEVPKITKIIVNMGVGEGKDDAKLIDKAQEDLSLITGQKAIKTKAKKAISGFKIRAGMPLGVMVTLRNKIMYEFLDRLINIAIPRIRDFRGLSPSSFDGNGNYSFGIKEHIIFPEINFDKIDKVRGMDITICTSSSNNNAALELLKSFNMPFKNMKAN